MNLKLTLFSLEIKTEPKQKKNGSAPKKTQVQSQTINNNIKIAQK